MADKKLTSEQLDQLPIIYECLYLDIEMPPTLTTKLSVVKTFIEYDPQRWCSLMIDNYSYVYGEKYRDLYLSLPQSEQKRKHIKIIEKYMAERKIEIKLLETL